MRSAAAGAAGLGAASVVGCGDDDDDDDDGRESTAAASGTVASGTPRSGGTWRSVQSIQDFIDPAISQGTGSGTGHLVYEWLAIWDTDKAEAIPHLAQSWEQPDASQIVFNLDPRARWQDKPPLNGRELTSEDIKFTLEYYTTNDPRYQHAGEVEAIDIPNIETPDPRTLVLNLKRPFVPQLRQLFTTIRYFVVPREIIERDGTLEREGIGSGPFILEDWTQTSGARMVRNPNYWKEGLPYLEGVQHNPIRDFAAGLSAFHAGNLESVPLSIDQLREVPGDAVVHKTPNFHFAGLRFNMTRPPFDDRRVRRAIHLAIDRFALNEISYAGESEPSGPVPPVFGDFAIPQDELLGLPGFRRDKEEDLAEARRLLEEAGVSDLSIRIPTTTAGNPNTAAYFSVPTIAVVDQLAQIGIDVTPDVLDFAQFNPLRVSGDFDVLSDAQVTTGDPDSLLRQSYYTGGTRNYGQYSNAQIDRLIDQQSVEADHERRVEIVREIQRMLLEDMPLATFFYAVNWTAYQPYVRGLSAGPNAAWQVGNSVWLDR